MNVCGSTFACTCSCVGQNNVRPVMSLEIQLNYFIKIALTRERDILQQSFKSNVNNKC